MTITKEELGWGKDVKFRNGDEFINMEDFISDILTKIEDGVASSEDGNFEFKLSWTDAKGGNREYLYDWMKVGRQGQFAGRAMRGNFDAMSKKLSESGIHCRRRVVYFGDSPCVIYYFSKKPFSTVVPDGHVSKKSKKERVKIVKEALGVSKEAVNHPDHYNDGKVECIDAIEAATAHLSGPLGFSVGNNIKYNWRLGLKNPTREGVIEDLEKSMWYIKRAIEYVKAGGPIFSSDLQNKVVENDE